MDHVHSYYSAVVNIALYFTILEIFDVKNVMILKSRLGGRSPCAEIYKKVPVLYFIADNMGLYSFTSAESLRISHIA